VSRGLRREAVIVLAVATLLLAILSVGTLASYRAAMLGLAERHELETRRSFARWARGSAPDPALRAQDLQAQLPGLLSLEFRPRQTVPEAEAAPSDPSAETVEIAVPIGGEHLAIGRFDNSAFARQAQRLRWLTPVVIGAALAATLVLLLFARRLLLPYDRLLESARAAGLDTNQDEIGFLVATFQHAAAMAESRHRVERERLDENLRRLGEVSAGIAHEFRNGLATIQGHTQLALRGAAAEQREDLEALAQEATHLERVVGDFLTFARPGSARSEEFDLVQLVERAMADPAIALVARIETRPPGKRALLIHADRVLLDRAIRNLLRNASEAQSRGDQPAAGVGITIGLEAKVAVVEIRDHGPGWPTALRERLGEPFVTDRPGGVGLGLALVHRIARLHGGDLRLLDAPGGGALVRLELPRDLVRGEIVT
jgi:signal transduction histidine kinase